LGRPAAAETIVRHCLELIGRAAGA